MQAAPRSTAAKLGVLAAVYAVLIALPHFLSFSQKEILVFLVINVLLVVSYRLLTLTGEWSLAHVVIMGAGAYGSALCSKELGVPVPLSMLLGAACAGLVAFLLSFPLFRMKGFYFLIGSFAAGEVIRLCWSKFRVPFGGPKGLKRIELFPELDFGSFTVSFFDPVSYYYLCLVVVSVSLLILYRLEHSRTGLTFHAIHWQDKLAESVGVNTWRYRTVAFVIASFFGGLAGTLLVHYLGTTSPNQYDVNEMVYVLIWVIVGGTATFFGPILGVVTLTVINEVVLRQLGLDLWRPLFYGVVLIVSIRYLPAGLESIPQRWREWRLRTQGDEAPVAEKGSGPV
jgi:branched-chain amino acid transport system permease protein